MCYAKPGPRCYGHAKTRVSSLQKKLASYPKESVQYQNTKEKLESAEARCDATQQRIQRLQQELTKNAEDKNLLHRLAQAKIKFEESMRSYDEKFGTVDGKKPSCYATVENIKYLQRRLKIAEAMSNQKTVRVLTNRLRHAEKTMQRKTPELFASLIQSAQTNDPAADYTALSKKLHSFERKLLRANAVAERFGEDNNVLREKLVDTVSSLREACCEARERVRESLQPSTR